MKIIESNPRGPLSELRLQQFEESIGTMLPDEYRAFLLRHNGPSLEPTSFRSLEGEELSSIEGYFYGLFEAKEFNLQEIYEGSREELPNRCLAIVCDGCGNEVCIGLDRDERGKIFFYNHEVNDAQTPVGEMELIANTFDEFIEGLYEFQEESSAESEASPSLFGIFVKAYQHEGNLPGALMNGQTLDGYIMKGRNKTMSKVPADSVIPLFDATVAGAQEVGPVSKDFLHGSVENSLEFYLPGNHQLSIGVTDQKYLICEGRYWKIGEESWESISQMLASTRHSLGLDD